MQTVQVRVNEEGALRNQRYAFSDRYTLVSELLQNARRAGATQIAIDYDERTRVLSVSDDGRGIEDFQSLLTFNESGWDEATRHAERPFGIGFSKCLYAASRCVVNSRGHQIDFDTRAALAKTPIELVSVLDQPGTSIVLFEVDLPNLGERLTRLCRGFPVPVFFNGADIARPYAAERLSLADTHVGKVHLVGTQDGKSSLDTLVFLQGFCVIDKAYYAPESVNIVHLDPTRFMARLPDRDKLIDEDEQRKRIEAALAALWHAVLSERKRTLPAQVFCERFFATARRWGCTELFNDVPVLQRALCQRIVGYPVRQGYADVDCLGPCEEPITRHSVQARGVQLCELDSPDEDTIALWVFARARGFVVLDADALDAGHWVHAHVRHLDTEPTEVSLLDEQCRGRFESRWIALTVVACASYAIRIGGEVVTISNEALYDAPHARIVVPRDEHGGEVCRQASDYIDEDGHWYEADQRSDIAAMADLIRHLRAVDPKSTLHALIESLGLERYPLLWGKRFCLSIGTAAREHAIELLP